MPTEPTGSTPRVVIAVDGPSGSGKSTVSREVARRLSLTYLDTGAMYRAVCWWCLNRGVPLADTDAVAAASRVITLHMGTDPDAPTVVVHGRDITSEIRHSSISSAVSAVATNLGVREELRRRQRQIIDASVGGCVVEGRDITTVVAPDADLRVLLTADEGARLARRALEVHGVVDEMALAATHDQVVRRDRDDATVSSFLTAADGVLTLDSSRLSLEQTIGALMALVEQVTGAGVPP